MTRITIHTNPLITIEVEDESVTVQPPHFEPAPPPSPPLELGPSHPLPPPTVGEPVEMTRMDAVGADSTM